MQSNQEKLYDLISSTFEVSYDKINDEMSPENTESWDSLNTVKMVIEIENEFNIRLELEEISTINKVSDIKNLLNAHGLLI